MTITYASNLDRQINLNQKHTIYDKQPPQNHIVAQQCCIKVKQTQIKKMQ